MKFTDKFGMSRVPIDESGYLFTESSEIRTPSVKSEY